MTIVALLHRVLSPKRSSEKNNIIFHGKKTNNESIRAIEHLNESQTAGPCRRFESLKMFGQMENVTVLFRVFFSQKKRSNAAITRTSDDTASLLICGVERSGSTQKIQKKLRNGGSSMVQMAGRF